MDAPLLEEAAAIIDEDIEGKQLSNLTINLDWILVADDEKNYA